jgi:hypothetical protein
MEPIKFPEGDFYSCYGDAESLTWTEPEEALESHLDDLLEPKMSVAEVVTALRAHPVTVYAYKPTTISDKQIEAWAESLTESLGEMFSEEHGDPEEGCGGGFPADADATMREAVTKIVRASHIWTCSVSGSVTLTPDQVEELMREYQPDWFKEPGHE